MRVISLSARASAVASGICLEPGSTLRHYQREVPVIDWVDPDQRGSHMSQHTRDRDRHVASMSSRARMGKRTGH